MAKAIYHENKKQIKENVSSGKVDINKPGVSGFTYLLYAIFLERYDIVKVLLELGADPNQLSIIKHPDGSIEKLNSFRMRMQKSLVSYKVYKNY